MPARARRIFDAAKVHDHHAIIPTGKVPNLDALSADERRIFDLVARRFLGAFHPDAEIALTEAVVRVGEPDGVDPAASTGTPEDAFITALPAPPDRFVARGRVLLVAGWQAVAGLDKKSGGGARDKATDSSSSADDQARLPPLAEGQRLDGRFEVLDRQTRPPPRHTEATLLAAMESAGREIEDEALRAAMKDTGLGTPATRAATIETLLKRKFIAREGKLVVATPTGIDLIERLPVSTLASPELTGAWEARLARISRGQEARTAFMADIARYVREMTDAIRGAKPGPAAVAATKVVAKKTAVVTPVETNTAAKVAVATPLPCPRCKQGALMAGRRGWGCTRWREGCAFVIWFESRGTPPDGRAASRSRGEREDPQIQVGTARRRVARRWAAGAGSGGDAGRRRRRAISAELIQAHHRPAAGLRRGGAGRSATIISPRASVATSVAIFFERPAGVFIALVRNASENRFRLLSVAKVFFARGLAQMAARRSAGMLDASMERWGA